MIKAITAATCEIDDPQAAAAEITAALNLEKNLLKNSLGIISYFSEFEETGVLKAVCDALPFDCIGSTSCLCAAGQEITQIMLAITVLTSDECSFRTTAIPITENYEESVSSSVSDLLAQSKEKPSLFLSYFPLMSTVSGDMILTAIDNATGGIPLFGTTAVDHTMGYTTAKTLCNGKTSQETAVLGAVYNASDFKFEVASLDKEKIRRQKAIITQSNGNILISVNGKTALEYLEEIGLTKDDLISGLGVIPLVVDYKDGTKPVARAVFALTPEGHVVCGGAMPQGATLALGRVDLNDVLQTTETVLQSVAKKDSFVLSYSCLARYLILSNNFTAEAEKVKEVVNGSPYLFAYSGGEICPLLDADGKWKNYYHNYTNVFCRLS